MRNAPSSSVLPVAKYVETNRTAAWESQAIKNSKETYDSHAQGIDAKGLRAEHAREINLEQVTGCRGKDGARKKNGGLPGNVAHLLPELGTIARARLCLRNDGVERCHWLTSTAN